MPWVLYQSVVRLWWTYDDAFLLRYASTHPPRGYFFTPSVWQEIPNRLFTPLLPLIYDWDLALFRFDPASHYVHHLADLSVCALLFYAMLRLWHRPLASATAVTAFFLGTPMVEWASQLMVRHYVYALSACFLTIITFVRYERDRGRASLAISVASFCVALMAKEFAVLLPAVLWALGRRGVRSVQWHLLAVALYLAWRWSMLGTLVGGYGWTMTRTELATAALLLPGKMLAAMTARSLPLGLALAAVFLLLLARLFARPQRLWPLAALFLMAVVPFAPVAKQLELRYCALAWLALVIAALAGAESWRAAGYRLLPAVLAAVGMPLLTALHQQQWRATFSVATRMTAEAHAFVGLGAGDILRNPLIPPAAMGETDWIKQFVLRRPPGSRWIYDDFFFCAERPAGRVVEYQRGRIVDVTPLAAGHARAYCTTLRAAPLSAEFRHRRDTLSWRLGPHEHGRYRFIVANGVQAFDVPREGGFQLPGLPGIALRVRYQSPEGWVTYSPELVLDFARQPDVRWSRDQRRQTKLR